MPAIAEVVYVQVYAMIWVMVHSVMSLIEVCCKAKAYTDGNC